MSYNTYIYQQMRGYVEQCSFLIINQVSKIVGFYIYNMSSVKHLGSSCISTFQ